MAAQWYLLTLPPEHTNTPVKAQIAKLCLTFDFAHTSLISFKQFCDDGCNVEYDSTNCYVYFKKSHPTGPTGMLDKTVDITTSNKGVY